MPTATVSRHIGICPVCAREQKLTTDSLASVNRCGNELKLVHHGYERPVGCGIIVA